MRSLSNRAALALVLAFAAGLAGLVILPPLFETRPKDIEAALDGNPDIRLTIAALRADYPHDYRALIERLAARAQGGGDRQALDREAAAFMADFMAAKAGFVAGAPDAQLREVAIAYAGLIRMLRDRDPDLCARFVTNGMPEGAPPPRSVTVRLDRISALRIRAARAGESGGRPPRAGLSPEDRRAWFARLARNDAASAALLAAGTIDRAPPLAQCKAGLALYQAAAELPAAQSANVMAGLSGGAIPAARSR